MTVIEMLDAVIQMPVANSDQPMTWRMVTLFNKFHCSTTWYICSDQDALVHVVDLQQEGIATPKIRRSQCMEEPKVKKFFDKSQKLKPTNEL